MASHLELVCIDCGHHWPFAPFAQNCPACDSEWFQVGYDYAELARTFLPRLSEHPWAGLWRYLDVLPLNDPSHIVSLGEGSTPLVRVTNLGLMLGRPNIYIKDERQAATGSFKDRQATLAVSLLKEAGITDAVVASTGNVAISYAAYCARAGIKLYAFLTSLVVSDKMRECALYGAQVVKVTSTYDRCKEIAQQFAHQRNMYYDRGLRSIAGIEGMKTIAYELSEQLGHLLPGVPTIPGGPAPAPWRAPDWYIQSVSGGLGPVGVIKGFQELKTMGLIDRLPALACIQAEGCAPMVTAFRQHAATAEPVSKPATRIATLATGNPGRAYPILKDYIDQHGGAMETVSDDEAYRALHVLAKMEGISMEPAAAVAFAGLFKLVRDGYIGPDDVVAINCTGHTHTVQAEVLGEGWARDFVPPAESAAAAPEPEGLLAALERLDQRVRSIAIVEDNPDAVRLIRRILQAKANYQIYEAYDGFSGLTLIRQQLPNLVILDLMMPEMDGFAVLDALRADPATHDIPVIVVTAKELTPGERARLSGQIESLLQKGAFMDDNLLDDIVQALT
jgi:threonine synthase